MIDIWENRVHAPNGVIHGAATLFIAWCRPGTTWRMCGSFWDRALAEKAAREGLAA